MAPEKRILRTLDLVTTARLSGLAGARLEAVRQLRQILGSRNIVGIGVSEKISSVHGPMGKLALVFYVNKKKHSRKLKGNEVVPPAIPEFLSGGTRILTDVVELGKPKTGKASGPVAGGVRPRRGMQVVLDKGKRIGIVRDVNFRLLVSYDGTSEVEFREQVLTTSYGRATAAALVLERHSGRPAGRHAAAVADGCLFHPAGVAATGKVPGFDSRVR